MCVLYVCGVCVGGGVQRTGLRERKKKAGEKEKKLRKNNPMTRTCFYSRNKLEVQSKQG